MGDDRIANACLLCVPGSFHKATKIILNSKASLTYTLRKNDELQNPQLSLPDCEAKIPATVVAVAVVVVLVLVEMALSPHCRHSTHPVLDVLPFSKARLRGDI